ncbi:MAG: hypothetical protein JSR68_08200 [Proteobacteria bacterium]|nr:hypothetical protein [Pseudomonadota bacterium]
MYDEVLKGWQRVERPHHAAGSLRPRTEVLWLSSAASEALKAAQAGGSTSG